MANLLVFHQGYAGSGHLWCNALQDGSWQGDVQTPDTGMTASPSAVEFKGEIYCFHQGFSKNGQLWYNVYDGMAWQGDLGVREGTPTKDPNYLQAIMSFSPSAVFFNRRIYCFFQGAGEDHQLYVATFDGANWSLLGAAPQTYLSHSPSAAVFNGQIYVFHQGYSNGRADGTMWYNIFDVNGWHGDQQVPNTGMSISPAALQWGTRLYVFHQSSGQTGELYFNNFGGNGWQGDLQVPGTGVCMSSSPSAAVLDDQLYCFYQSARYHGELQYTSFVNHNWSNGQLSDTGMTAAPSALFTTLPAPPAAIVAPNRSETRVESFDGWGTSLCWWANQFGGEAGEYGASYLADLIFGTHEVKDRRGNLLPGLGMNIVRYNIGGGGGGASIDDKTTELLSPTNPVSGCPHHYIRSFWKKWGQNDEQYNPNNPEYWDWSVDANQQNMLILARDRGADTFEFFSNSPPWWMCLNHSSSGGQLYNPELSVELALMTQGNLQHWNISKFAKYLVTVVEYAREHWGIDVQSLEPFNEPDPPCWFIFRPPDLNPLHIINPQTWYWVDQEGCNFGCNSAVDVGQSALQQEVIDALADELHAAKLQGKVALTASDWNSIPFALENLFFLEKQAPNTWKKVQKVNVHGYGGNDGFGGTQPYRGAKRAAFRSKVYELNPANTPKVWMSEVGDEDHSGMTLATSIMLDFAELWPSGWILWQPIDRHWGLFVPTMSSETMDCPDGVGDAYPSYYVFAQFSRHVKKGSLIIGDNTTIGNDDHPTQNDLKSIIAYDKPNHKLVIVTLNLERGRWITYDFSSLLTVNGPVKRWETMVYANGQAIKQYQPSDDVTLREKKFRIYCDPNSVNTFEIQGVPL